jgi:hypothetical protein
MASDQELRKLIEQIFSDQRAARRVMAGMTSAISDLANEQSLEIGDDQAKDVARSLLVARLADIAWPDTTSTSFENPVYRGE